MITLSPFMEHQRERWDSERDKKGIFIEIVDAKEKRHIKRLVYCEFEH
jgi:hypothetical protein